jgi:hypothetical protein
VKKVWDFAKLVDRVQKDPAERKNVTQFADDLRSIVTAVADNKLDKLPMDICNTLIRAGTLLVKVLATALGINNAIKKLENAVAKMLEQIKNKLKQLFSKLTQPMAKYLDKYTPPAGSILLIKRPAMKNGHTLLLQLVKGKAEVVYSSTKERPLAARLAYWVSCRNDNELAASLQRAEKATSGIRKEADELYRRIAPRVGKAGEDSKAVLNELVKGANGNQKIIGKLKDLERELVEGRILEEFDPEDLPEPKAPTIEGPNILSHTVAFTDSMGKKATAFFPKAAFVELPPLPGSIDVGAFDFKVPPGWAYPSKQTLRDFYKDAILDAIVAAGGMLKLGSKDKYEALHVIAKNFNGPDREGNFIPGSVKVNRSFFGSCEKLAKHFIFGCKRSLQYEVSFKYPTDPPTSATAAFPKEIKIVLRVPGRRGGTTLQVLKETINRNVETDETATCSGTLNVR